MTAQRVLGAVDPTPRVIGAVRQSRTRDKSLSAEAQAKAIAAWADANGATVAKVTKDLSTSGGTSAFRRAGLGPYLTEPDKIATWDTLVVTRLDRACRNLADYLKLAEWCDRNGKRLVVLDDPSLDTSTAQGRAMANMRATFAQYEREMAKARNKERYEEMKAQGRWVGGTPNYGYRYDPSVTPVPGDPNSQLVPDNGGTADVLRTMADMAIDDKSQWQIARWLNDNGHRTNKGKNWTQDTVRRVLRHDATRALLGEARADQLAAALRNRTRRSGERVNGRGLLGIAFCRECGEPLYANVMPNRESGGYYRHLPNRSATVNCHVRVRRYDLEMATEDRLLFLCGDLEYAEYQLIPGDDHQAAIHALEREIEMLEKISGAESLITVKQAEIEHLRTMPYDPDHWQPVPQGIKVRDHWATLDEQGKTAFMRQRKVRVFADKHTLEFHGGLLAESATVTGTLDPVRQPQIP